MRGFDDVFRYFLGERALGASLIVARGAAFRYIQRMSNLDDTIARMRTLPKAEQDALAAQIEVMLDQGAEDFLTPEQWAAIEARLESSETLTPHSDVVKAFHDRFR